MMVVWHRRRGLLLRSARLALTAAHNQKTASSILLMAITSEFRRTQGIARGAYRQTGMAPHPLGSAPSSSQLCMRINQG